MNMVRVAIPIVAVCCFFKWTMGTEIIPERAEVFYFNEKYLSHAIAFVKRYVRRSPYYFNLEGTVLQTLGENVTANFEFYEFLHNEYKRSFVEFSFKLCDVLTKSPWKDLAGDTLVAHGFVCPLLPGPYRFDNITLALSDFPYVVPFEKAKAEFFLRMELTQEIIMRARFFASFKKKLPKGNKKL